MFKELVKSKYNEIEYDILKQKFIFYKQPKNKYGKTITSVPDSVYENLKNQYRKLRQALNIPEVVEDVTKLDRWDGTHPRSKEVEEEIRNLTEKKKESYNIIYLSCPWCDEFNLLKTESGTCNGKTIMIEAADLSEIVDLMDIPHECPECGDSYYIAKEPQDIRPDVRKIQWRGNEEW